MSSTKCPERSTSGVIVTNDWFRYLLIDIADFHQGV